MKVNLLWWSDYMDKNISKKIQTNYKNSYEGVLELYIEYLTLKGWMKYIENSNLINYDRHLVKTIRKEFNRICILRKELLKEIKK